MKFATLAPARGHSRPMAEEAPSRNDPLDFGNFASSWIGASPTPGTNLLATLDYASWAAGLGAGGPDEDPDGDKITNLLEFAQGSNPFEAGTAITTSVSGGQILINFDAHSNRTDIQLTLESSDDLEAWSTEATSIIESNGPIDNRQFSGTISSAQKTFYRLSAVILN